MDTIINYTPHTLHIFGLDGKNQVQEILSTGNARVSFKTIIVGEISEDSVPIVRQEFGPVTGLPLPEPNVWWVVSRMVASACPDRDDLLVPGDPVRDSEGCVVGCKGLALP